VGIAVAAASAGPAYASATNCSAAPGGGLTLANVAAAGPRVRAVGSNGLVAASGSPGNWRVLETPVEHDLRGVVPYGARWIAIGDIGTILTREAGQWTIAPDIPNSGMRGIAARPGLIAASGSNGVIVTSADGLTWHQAVSATSEILWGGTAAGSQLVLSGRDSTVLASPDGEAWSPVPTFPAPTDSTAASRPLLWQVAANGDELVAVGDFGAILHGFLGSSGGLAAVASPTDEILRGVAYNGRSWVAVGSGGEVLYSHTGSDWALAESPTTVDLRGVAWTGSRWVAVGDQSTVISSAANAIDWTVEVSAMPCALLGLARGEHRWVAVGGAGRVLASSNSGRRWHRMSRPTDSDLYGATHGPGRVIAVGSSGTILSSANEGKSWVERRSHTQLDLRTVFWTGERYLAGGDIGRVLSSANGRRWQQVDFPGFHSVRGFATDGSTVIAAGAGTVATLAPEASEWDLEQIGFARFQTAIAYGAGRFVIVGHNGEVLVSTDAGQSWTQGPAGVEVNLDAVTWTGSRFIATGEGIAIVSADGLAWTPLTVPTHRSVRALVPYGDVVVGVGDGNTRIRLPAD
jgi:photosystem II stability/assembly factor-like uncharacterized protein